MPRGDKSKYTGKQDRKADHIAKGYEKRGVSHKEAERRAWATVNKESGGGNKSGSGRGKKDTKVSSRKGGKLVVAPRQLDQRRHDRHRHARPPQHASGGRPEMAMIRVS